MGYLRKGTQADTLWCETGFKVECRARGNAALVVMSDLNPDKEIARLFTPGDLLKLSWWFAKQAIKTLYTSR